MAGYSNSSGNARFTPPARAPKLSPAAQALNSRMKPKRFDCGIHGLTYEALDPGCPACEAEREVAQLRRALQEANGKLAVLTEQARGLQAQVDFTQAMRDAVQLVDDKDLMFFKEVLYRFRDNKSVNLKVTRGAVGLSRRDRATPPPNGFIVIQRVGDPYGHSCESMGGLAIAQYYDEAVNTYGAGKAMEILVRAFSEHLPGSS